MKREPLTLASIIDAIPLRLTTAACAWCVVVFLALGLREGGLPWEEAARWGFFAPNAVWEGKPWSLLLSTFVHLELVHLAFNVYWLWILGQCLEEHIGSLRFAAFFIAAAWISAGVQLLSSGDAGIGMSGVGYALFGFGWVARHKMPALAGILDRQTAFFFVVWLIGCAIATELGLANIANAAHIAGLLFGAAVAYAFVERSQKKMVWVAAPVLGVMAALSFLPLRWCPTSPEWTAAQAFEAHQKGDLKTAEKWYTRTLERGHHDKSWAWTNLAAIYGTRGERAQYQKALEELRRTDTKAAQEVEDEFGPPEAIGTANEPSK